jgi:hypothetical protein
MRHPSRPISRVLCGGSPRPAIISLGARVATRLQQPTRGSNGSSRTVLPFRGSPLFGLAPDGGCQTARLAADVGGLLHRRFTLTRLIPDRFLFFKKWIRDQTGNTLLCGPVPAGCPAPGITRRRALWSADFPRPRICIRGRDRPAGLDAVITITRKFQRAKNPFTAKMRRRRRNFFCIRSTLCIVCIPRPDPRGRAWR